MIVSYTNLRNFTQNVYKVKLKHFINGINKFNNRNYKFKSMLLCLDFVLWLSNLQLEINSLCTFIPTIELILHS